MIALVASTAAGSSTSNGVTSSSINTTGANLLIVWASSWGANPAPSVSDSKSNSWTQRFSHTNGSNRVTLFWCVPSSVGTGHTFTLSGTQTYPTVLVSAFSGAHSSPVDTGIEDGAGGLGVSGQPGSITPSENNCLVVASTTREGGTADAIGSSFTITNTVSYVAGQHFMGGQAYKIQTTAGAENPTWSWTTSTSWLISIASFKAADVAAQNASEWMPIVRKQVPRHRVVVM